MTTRETIPADIPEDAEREVYGALAQMVADERRYAGSPWRPIATAPKDGTAILGWWGGECMIVDWCVVVERWGSTHDGEDMFEPEPTHWMPLPDGPKE
jgi:hypothetical protein